MSIHCIIISLALMILPAASKPFASASCLYHGTACTKTEAVRSGFCRPGIRAKKQAKTCVGEACTYCLRKVEYQQTFPCDSSVLSELCGFSLSDDTPVSALDQQVISAVHSTTPTPSPTHTYTFSPSSSPTVSASPKATLTPSTSSSAIPTPTTTGTPSSTPWLDPAPTSDVITNSQPSGAQVSSSCVWSVRRDQVTVDLSTVEPADGWTRCKRDGLYGLVYKKEKTHGIDGKGNHGVMCFDIRAPSDGTYYMTALSYAPHNTEHNDVWVRCNKPMELWRHAQSRSAVAPNTWLKAYQNKGKAGISEEWKTIDRNGHRLLVPGLVKDAVFQVCLSGRSYKYELFRLVFIRCQGPYCTGKMYERVAKRSISVCVPNKT